MRRYLLEIDINAINGEGIVTSGTVSFIRKFELKKTIWGKDEALPGVQFTTFYRSFKASLPTGVDSNYEIVKQEYGPLSDSTSHVIMKIILCPSPVYIKERYLYYYSRDFENRLINHHSKELEMMFKYFSSQTYIKYHGLCVADDDTDRCVLYFSSIGLKPLNSLTQIYTLTKVLTDHLSKYEKKNYYIRAHLITDSTQKESLEFRIVERPVHYLINNKLKEW